jgi:cytidylate kinase
MQGKIIIAIDGFSSCGKSTIAKAIASSLGYAYIDTGAMYRAVTLFFIQNNIILSDKGLSIIDHEYLLEVLDNIDIHFHYNPQLGYSEVFLNSHNVEKEIRQMFVSDFVSKVSAIKEVRQKLVHMQQIMGMNKGVVMDGRDIGTTVFPAAELKFFMIADPEVRAKRRFNELTGKGEKVSLKQVITNLTKRDHLDTHRAESPLMKAPDAIVLDNTALNQQEQLDFVLNLVGAYLQKNN